MRRIIIAVALAGIGASLGACSNYRKDANSIAAETDSRVSPISSEFQDQLDRDRASLGRMKGRWNVSGWSRTANGDRREPTGTVVGSVEHQYFLDLAWDLSFNDSKAPARHTGSMLFGAERGKGITLVAWFDSSVSKSHFQGSASVDGSVLYLRGVRGPTDDRDYHVTIKFLNDNEWTMEFRDHDQNAALAVGALRFVRALVSHEGPARIAG